MQATRQLPPTVHSTTPQVVQSRFVNRGVRREMVGMNDCDVARRASLHVIDVIL